MKVVRIIIVGNGVLDRKFLTEITQDDYCIGVDYAAFWLVSQGRVPDVAIGDFDSVTPDQYKEIRKRVPDIIRFSPEKDFTDMELAVRHAIRRKPQEIILFGALGKRLDQALANIGLLETIEEKGIKGSIRDSENSATIVSTSLTITDGTGYVSILPVTEKANISMTGFKYSVGEKAIRRGQTIGISNELMGKTGLVTVTKGKVLVILSRE